MSQTFSTYEFLSVSKHIWNFANQIIEVSNFASNKDIDSKFQEKDGGLCLSEAVCRGDRSHNEGFISPPLADR